MRRRTFIASLPATATGGIIYAAASEMRAAGCPMAY